MTDLAGGAIASSPDANAAASAAAETVAPQKIKVKIDGSESEVELAELQRDYQKYRSADKRFQEAAELRKASEAERQTINQLLSRAQQGDLAWLKGLVPNDVLTKWAESELLQHIEWQKMPETERRALLAEQRAQELEAKVQGMTQTQERQQASALQEQAYQQIEQEIVETVKELGYDYKVTPRFVRRIAEQMYASLEASDDPQAAPMPAKIARERAWKGLLVDAQELLSTLPPREALGLIPPALREAIRRADVESVTSQLPSPSKGRGQPAEPAPKKSKLKRMSTEDYFAKLDKHFG